MTSTLIARLRRLAAALPALGEDGAWMADRLTAYLDARGAMTLDDALGVAVAPGGEPWWRAEARSRRDVAIRALADRIAPGASTLCASKAVDLALRRYAASAWRADRALAAAPASYLGTSRALMFEVLRHSGGRPPPGASQIRAILSSRRQQSEIVANEMPAFRRQQDEAESAAS